MKKIWLTLGLTIGALSAVWAQQSKVIVDNDKIKITQFTSLPGADVCGKGLHSHMEHGIILMTDAKLKVTLADGTSHNETFDSKKHQLTIETNSKKQIIPNDGAFWAKGETHEVMNVNNKPLIYYMIETK
ncbi:MAG: hypothetical protein QM763_12870 [Agriterribacter sp.]